MTREFSRFFQNLADWLLKNVRLEQKQLFVSCFLSIAAKEMN